MELSELPAKPVVSPSGERFGYIKEVYVCKNLVEIASVVCFDEEEEEFVLPARALIAVGDAAVVSAARVKTPKGIPCPVGKAVFDGAGTFLGHCSGLETESGVLSVGIGEEKKHFPAERARVADVAIVPAGKDEKGRPAKNGGRVRKTQRAAKENAAEERPDEMFGLLGKQLKKTVEGVAEQGETVTAATLKRARENNKLLELTANTLTE